MAASKEELLLNAFLAVAGSNWSGTNNTGLPKTATGADSAQLSEAAATVAQASEAQTQLLGNFAQALQGSPVYQGIQAAQSSGEQSTVSEVVSAVLGSALGMVPLAKAVIGLFTGGGPDAPPPLVRYALPAPLRMEAANGAGDAVQGMDYGQDGLPRMYWTQSQQDANAYLGDGADATGGQTTWPTTLAATDGTAQAAAPQVNIQVQAMDSQSFLDHKDDIARAVREAMLNMHSLNDVVNEL